MAEPQSNKISRLPLLAVVMITSFLTTFTGSALNLSVPAISTEFHAGAVSISWIVTGYILASAVLSVPFGRFADLRGKKPVLVTGQLLFTACAFLCSIAWNIETIIAFRLAQGIGAAMIFATNVALLVASYPPEKRGKMIGLSVSATYAGLSLGPVVGGVMNHHFGWRSIFYITAALAASAALLAIFRLKEPADHPETLTAAGTGNIAEAAGAAGTGNSVPVTGAAEVEKKIPAAGAVGTGNNDPETGAAEVEKKIPAAGGNSGEKKQKMDLTGCILYSSMLACIMYGFSSITTGILAKILLPLGILLFIPFVRHESRTKDPLVNLDMFRKNTVFTFSNIAALLNYGASYAVSYLLSIYLQTVLGFDSQIAGLILITSPVFQTVLSPVAGRLSDRYSPFVLTSCGMAISAVGIFSFIFLRQGYPLGLVIAALVVIGVGFAFFSSPNTNAIMSCVDKADYSIASSVTATSRSIGHTLSMAIVTTVVAVTVGNVTLASASPQSVLFAMRVSFIIFTILCVAGIFFSARRK